MPKNSKSLIENESRFLPTPKHTMSRLHQQPVESTLQNKRFILTKPVPCHSKLSLVCFWFISTDSSSSLHSPVVVFYATHFHPFHWLGPKSIQLGSFSCTILLHHLALAEGVHCAFSSVTATDRVGRVFWEEPFCANLKRAFSVVFFVQILFVLNGLEDQTHIPVCGSWAASWACGRDGVYFCRVWCCYFFGVVSLDLTGRFWQVQPLNRASVSTRESYGKVISRGPLS